MAVYESYDNLVLGGFGVTNISFVSSITPSTIIAG